MTRLHTATKQLSSEVPIDASIFERVRCEVQIYVDRLCSSQESIRVLEAGSGSRSHVRLNANAKLIGMDISQEELDRHPALNEAILGDIQTYPLASESFDLIVCWDVLEHVPRPQAAMENFARALRPGGLLIVGSPVVNSLKGIVTKFTPLRFHSFVFRYLVHGGRRNSDWQSGPFRTFLRTSMSPSALQRFAHDRQLQVEYVHIYQAPIQQRLRNRHFAFDLAFRIAAPLIKAASFNWIDPDVTDFVMILKKSHAAIVPDVVSLMTRSA